MAEYIERESAYPLAKKICDAVISGNPEQIFLGRYILDWIDEIPAVDVRPATRGKWDDKPVAFFLKCSECGCCVGHNRYDVFLDRGELNFCPNCGADMREGE